MEIQSTHRFTIVEKRFLEEAGEYFYGAATRSAGDTVYFVSKENYRIGARVTPPKKPADPVTIAQAYKRSVKTLPLVGTSVLIGMAPQAAKALGPEKAAKVVFDQTGIPSEVASIKSVQDVVDKTIELSQQPAFRHFAVFFAGVFGAFGFQAIWFPDRSWKDGLLTALLVGFIVWAIYAAYQWFA